MILKENIKYKIFESAKHIDCDKMVDDMMKWVYSEDARSPSGDAVGLKFENNGKKYRFFMKTVDHKNALVVMGTVSEVEKYESKIIFGTLETSDD